MSIKNNINKTEQLANNLKERVNSINQTITSNNGQISNNLSEMPNNINKMLGQYKKIAIGNVYYKISKSSQEINIPINLNFEANKFLVKFECTSNGERKVERYIPLKTDSGLIPEYFYFGDYKRFRYLMSGVNVSKYALKFNIYIDWGDGFSYELKMTEWIAIE